MPGDDDYDPHTERVASLTHPTSNIETFFHLFKGIMGTGILAMPEAFKFVGLINGCIFTIIVAMILSYSLQTLIRAQYIVLKRSKVYSMRYADTVKASVEMGPPWARKYASLMGILVDVFLMSNQLGCCIVYVVFVGHNMAYVVNLWIGEEMRVEAYTLIFASTFLFVICIRNLKYLAPFSMAASFIQILVFAVICYYMFETMPPFGQDVALFKFPLQLPLYLGTVVFALLAMGVFVTVEYNMKTPKDFPKVLNATMIAVTIMYTSCGFFGYWRYNKDVESSLTLNLPRAQMLGQLVIFGYCWGIIVSYGLQGYCASEIVYGNYRRKSLGDNKYLIHWEYLTRIEFFAGTFILGCAVPLLGIVISFVGSFALSCLGIVFPAIMEICVLYPDYGKLKWDLYRNILIMLFGLTCFISGTYSCTYEIVVQMMEGV